jgi:hypothetical protein
VSRTRLRHLPSALPARTVVLAAILAGRPAGAQTIFQADGSAGLGYTRTALTPLESRRLYAEVRPALVLRFGSPWLAWQAGYLFAGSLTLDGTGTSSYSNRLSLSLAADLSQKAALSASAVVTQGGSAFQLTQGAPEAGQPAFRAPGNPDLVTATVAEAFSWDPSPHLNLGQGLLASASAPQDSLRRASTSLTGSMTLDRLFSQDAVGAALLPGFALLRPLAEGAPDVRIVTTSLIGSWNHDFNRTWNAQVTAGATHVVAVGPGHPTTVVPVGSLTGRYLGNDSVVSLEVTRAVATNLQTGTESVSEEVTLRGGVSLDPIRQRQLGASVGFLRARSLGEVTPGAAAGSGKAAQGDVGLVWGLSDVLLATARYSIAYQFEGAASESLVHVALVGITVRYSSAPYMPPMPTPGRRVDRGDAVGSREGDARKP